MYEKQGYLTKEFKIFHIKDKSDRVFDFHYHDFYKVILFIGGHVEYSVEGKNYELQPSDIVLVARNEIHKPVVDPLCEYERIVLYLSQSFLNLDPELAECFKVTKESHTNVMRLSKMDSIKLKDLLINAVNKSRTDNFGDALSSKLSVMEAILLLSESAHNNGLLFEGKVSYDKKILDVCEYINDHIKEDLSVEYLSEKFFISKYYFMHKFKEYTGVTVHQYILEKRVLYADNLAQSGEKVTAACIMAGFNDYSTYLRARKRLYKRLIESCERE